MGSVTLDPIVHLLTLISIKPEFTHKPAISNSELTTLVPLYCAHGALSGAMHVGCVKSSGCPL